jgi:hypothetical protein
MRVLVACEYSGRVREAFRKLGHDAWSCDLLPADDNSPYHFKGDVRMPLSMRDRDGSPYWDLMIAHPPCTYLASSGLHWNKRIPGREELTLEALQFIQFLMDAPVEKIAIENPIGRISSAIRKPDQIIQPWWFGEDASKSTCLWLKNLPPLTKTAPLIKARYANQTASGQNNLGPSADRWKLRSTTYQGIADAMANQWGRQ